MAERIKVEVVEVELLIKDTLAVLVLVQMLTVVQVAAERGRSRPRVSRAEKISPAMAMRWREVLAAPKTQAREGRAQNPAVGPRASVARVRRFWAGRMPSGP